MDQRIDHSRYKVIPRSLIFIFSGSNLLLISKYDKAAWAGKANVLGGHIEAGESILVSAYRELNEESGIIDVDLDYAGNIMIDGEGGLGVSLHLFKGEANSLNTSSSDEGSLSWVSVDDLPKIPVFEDLLILVPMVKDWKLGDPLIIGHFPNSEKSNPSFSF